MTDSKKTPKELSEKIEKIVAERDFIQEEYEETSDDLLKALKRNKLRCTSAGSLVITKVKKDFRHIIDVEALRRDYPRLAAKYTKKVIVREHIRISRS